MFIVCQLLSALEIFKCFTLLRLRKRFVSQNSAMTPGVTRRVRAQPMSAVSEVNTSSIAPTKKKRGKAMNKKLIDYKAATGQKPRIEIHKDHARPVGRWSTQFVREIGVVARQHGPLTGSDWDKVEEDVRGPLRDRIKDKFDVDMQLPHVKYVVDKILGERLRGYRCLLHLHYKRFGNDAVARRNPYSGVAQDKWDACCDWFRREDFKKISEQNSSNRQKLSTNHCAGSKSFLHFFEESRDSETQQTVGKIEFYRRTHFSSKGWTSPVAQENYNRMRQLKVESEAEGGEPKTEDEIFSTVLGVRSGYCKGLGHGVMPPSARRMRSIHLEEEVQRSSAEEEVQRTRAEEAEKRNDELTAEMVSQRTKLEEVLAVQARMEAWMLQFSGGSQ